MGVVSLVKARFLYVIISEGGITIDHPQLRAGRMREHHGPSHQFGARIGSCSLEKTYDA